MGGKAADQKCQRAVVRCQYPWEVNKQTGRGGTAHRAAMEGMAYMSVGYRLQAYVLQIWKNLQNQTPQEAEAPAGDSKSYSCTITAGNWLEGQLSAASQKEDRGVQMVLSKMCFATLAKGLKIGVEVTDRANCQYRNSSSSNPASQPAQNSKERFAEQESSERNRLNLVHPASKHSFATLLQMFLDRSTAKPTRRKVMAFVERGMLLPGARGGGGQAACRYRSGHLARRLGSFSQSLGLIITLPAYEPSKSPV